MISHYKHKKLKHAIVCLGNNNHESGVLLLFLLVSVI